ncbi:L-aspartate oxidase [Eubacterium xylanophilum]|uniref:L-aspartate oxidase n=1 Tax=Eubacterium xylanophilum TaxID=39497 RepID=UPI000478B434|nr:L-aspartate oxidase [Eubacterium xylanophilum]
MINKTDVLIIGSGVAGLFAALHLPSDKQITIITKNSIEESDSFLAQGGICVLRSEDDYDSYYEDTMRAGHHENRKESVDIMIKTSRHIIDELIDCGVEFESENGEYLYTREGGHSKHRIMFHKDITGKEITSKVLRVVQSKKNIQIIENTTMIDVIMRDGTCYGAVIRDKDDHVQNIFADYTVMASGGIGGLYKHSTNFRQLTGDAIAIALKNGIKLENINYIQIHPTTLYSEKPGRRFLISESVRGEGAILLNKDGERFVDELLPRDLLTQKVYEQMEKDGLPYVRLSMAGIDEQEIKGHFPNIYEKCLEEGYDVTKDPIPVVPAQHYFMGGIWVDSDSKTSVDRLYAIGETSCNGVHGANRLASNSLLESLVFAERAANKITETYTEVSEDAPEVDLTAYGDKKKLEKEYKDMILQEIERINSHDE